MRKQYEIWGSFEDGLKAKYEVHKNLKSATAAIDAMNNKNQRELAEGYGFPHGVPTYYIVEK